MRKASLTLILATASCLPASRPPVMAHLVTARPRTTLLRGPVAPALTSESDRERVVRAARDYTGGAPLVADGYQFEPDPVGFVRASYWQVGVDLVDPEIARDADAGGLELLYRSASKRNSLRRDHPQPGDLAFFDSAPGDGAAYPSQVAVVEKVGDDGTITLLGSFSKGPTRVVMNLRSPELRYRGNRRINDVLLAGDYEANTGQLFRTFAEMP